MRSPFQRLVLVATVALALSALRLVHLESDTPRDLTTWSVGVFVDEGYKTLDARNRVLFGGPEWNPDDDYAGWREGSPLTHWAYYVALDRLGVELWSIRLVSVVAFTLLAFGFVIGHWKRYPTWLILVGLGLLAVSHTLFFFSRIALFELPMSLCLYASLFFLARLDKPVSIRGVVAFLALFAIAAFGVKRSAPVYFVPIGLGILVASVVAQGTRPRSVSVAMQAVVAIALVVVTYWLWDDPDKKLPNVKILNPAYVRAVLWSTMMHSSAPLIALGLGCTFHALLVEPRKYLSNPYRAGLIGLVLLGPPVISLFDYQPLRYYVPFLPASILLAVEWIRLRSWEAPFPSRVPALGAVALFVILGWFLSAAGLSIHRFVLTPVFWPEWKLPKTVPREVVAVGALVVGGSVLWFGRFFVVGRRALAVFLVLLAVTVGRDVFMVGRFLVKPRWKAREIMEFIAENIPAEKSIAGDWAPFLTIATPVRSLYMNPKVNRPARIMLLRPDYLMPIGNWDIESHVRKQRGLELLPPIFESEYAGRRVTLIPIKYLQPRSPQRATPEGSAAPTEDQ